MILLIVIESLVVYPTNLLFGFVLTALTVLFSAAEDSCFQQDNLKKGS